MAHRRSAGATTSDIRDWVAAEAREDHARDGNMILWGDPTSATGGGVRRLPGPSSDSRLADALDAGEPVVIAGWRLAEFIDGPYPAMVPAFRLEPDGGVTAMKAVHRGDTVYWEPAGGPALWRPAALPPRKRPARPADRQQRR